MITKIISIIKTLYVNYKCLPLKQAIHLPITVSADTKFLSPLFKGCFVIKSDSIKQGMILIGSQKGSFNGGGTNIIDIKKKGKIVFKGKCNLHAGIKLICSSGACIIFGTDSWINYDCIINSRLEIIFGEKFLCGWSCSFLDWDGHDIVSIPAEVVLNAPKPIIIGNHCWVSANATILKGVHLADETIIPYGSIIAKSNETPYCCFGGAPNRILKENITRK